MIFCRPKDKVTHCVKEILNDGHGDGKGDNNCGDGDTFCRDGEGMGTQPVGTGRGWGLTQWGKGIGTTGTVGDGDKFLSPCSSLAGTHTVQA